MSKELGKVERKIDNYYNRKDEAVYNQIIDESIKTVIIEEPPKSKNKKKQQNIKIDAVLKYIPRIFQHKSEVPMEMKIQRKK